MREIRARLGGKAGRMYVMIHLTTLMTLKATLQRTALLAVVLGLFCTQSKAVDDTVNINDLARQTLQEPDPELLHDTDEALRVRAQAYRLEADRQREAAQKTARDQDEACWDRFFVNACKAQVSDTRRTQMAQANKVEQQARRLERELRRRDWVARQADLQDNQEALARQAAQPPVPKKKKLRSTH
jgi:hypothetical protein